MHFPCHPSPSTTADLSALIRAIDKNFSAMGNYAKGHGAKEFAPWLQLTYPSEFLLKVVRANGSRQVRFTTPT